LLNWEWRVEKIVDETAVPSYLQTWFIGGIIIVTIIAVFGVVVIWKRKLLQRGRK